ncbi:GGDEF domain-containing protein [Martelella soudanensis]|uniref:GGDEF domain-containing protein n=1 Tax=unclassified Martelella TaxID=2629616 RepID=UPI0015DEF1FA|nr:MULTISPECIES: GGDEF domain-containing protein [unclassified Martelella]
MYVVYWVLALLAQAIGLALLMLAHRDDLRLIGMIAFTGLICARALSTAGLLSLCGEDRPAAFTMAIVGVWFTAVIFSRIAGFDSVANVASFYVAAFAISIYGFYFMVRNVHSLRVHFRRSLMAVFAFEALTCLALLSAYNMQNSPPSLGSATTSIALITGFVLFSLKGFLAVWLTVERLERDLRDLAFSDPLTNVLNRRGVIDEIEKMSHRSAKTDLFAFFSLDLDNFKSINDAHGHSAGDRALVNFTHVVRQCLRERDIFGRTGGEEFAIFTRVTDRKTAGQIAERIRSSLEATPFREDGRELRMTVSIGVTLMRGRIGDIESMLTEADRALYKAKGDGRNRIVFYDGPAQPLAEAAEHEVALAV